MDLPRTIPADKIEKREIERILAKELGDAKEASRRAEIAFNDVMASIPSGIPAPDSNLRVVQIGAEYRCALRAYRIALERWTNFVAKGVVPDGILDAKPSLAPLASAV